MDFIIKESLWYLPNIRDRGDAASAEIYSTTHSLHMCMCGFSFFLSFFWHIMNSVPQKNKTTTYNFTLIKVAAVKEDGVITQIPFGQQSLHFFMERFGVQMKSWETRLTVTETDTTASTNKLHIWCDSIINTHMNYSHWYTQRGPTSSETWHFRWFAEKYNTSRGVCVVNIVGSVSSRTAVVLVRRTIPASW